MILSGSQVQIGGADVRDTPVTLSVMKGIHSGTTFADGPGVGPRVFLGRPNPFTIHACDEDGTPLTRGGDSFATELKGPRGAIPVTQQGHSEHGQYPCTYTAPSNSAGPATLNIVNQRDGQPIKDMPLSIHICEPADHSKSYAEGPGLQQCWDDRENHFTIYAIDKNGQPVVGEDVKVLLAFHADAKAGGAAPARAAPASNEPEFIETEVEQIAKFCAACGEGNQKAKFCWNCGAKTRVTKVVQKVANPNYRGPGGARPAGAPLGVQYTDAGAVVDNGDGTYSAAYLTGDHQGFVFINVHIYGKEIKGVPVKLAITKGPSAEQCVAEGPGVEEGFVHRPNRFKVFARDADGKPLTTGGDDFRAQVAGPNGENVTLFLERLSGCTGLCDRVDVCVGPMPTV